MFSESAGFALSVLRRPVTLEELALSVLEIFRATSTEMFLAFSCSKSSPALMDPLCEFG